MLPVRVIKPDFLNEDATDYLKDCQGNARQFPSLRGPVPDDEPGCEVYHGNRHHRLVEQNETDHLQRQTTGTNCKKNSFRCACGGNGGGESGKGRDLNFLHKTVKYLFFDQTEVKAHKM